MHAPELEIFLTISWRDVVGLLGVVGGELGVHVPVGEAGAVLKRVAEHVETGGAEVDKRFTRNWVEWLTEDVLVRV